MRPAASVSHTYRRKFGSPRRIISALAIKSGCFQIHKAAGAKPADFLMNLITLAAKPWG